MVLPESGVTLSQELELGDLLHTSLSGFQVHDVVGHDGLVGVVYCAVRSAEPAQESGEIMTFKNAVLDLSGEEQVQPLYSVRFFGRTASANYEQFALHYPELSVFIEQESSAGEGGDGGGGETCERCPECNFPPCDVITMDCLKRCFDPNGG